MAKGTLHPYTPGGSAPGDRTARQLAGAHPPVRSTQTAKGDPDAEAYPGARWREDDGCIVISNGTTRHY